jgi:hypothetical protein
LRPPIFQRAPHWIATVHLVVSHATIHHDV